MQGGVGGKNEIRRVAADAQGLGLLVCYLVGMERIAAKDAFGNFAGGKALTANQIEFVNLIIDHLAEHGVVEPAALCESPFTDVASNGPDGLFAPAELDALLPGLTPLGHGRCRLSVPALDETGRFAVVSLIASWQIA